MSGVPYHIAVLPNALNTFALFRSPPAPNKKIFNFLNIKLLGISSKTTNATTQILYNWPKALPF